MKHLLLYFATFILSINYIHSQTSWVGGTNDDWKNSSNWTAGIPDQNTDAIIGDANFTGPNQPEINGNSKCKDLIIGNGVITSSLSIRKNLTVYGELFIGANGTINANHNKTITLKGNWTNNGAYNAGHANARVIFSGASQLITGVTTYNKVQINSSSTITLANNIAVNTDLKVYGKLNPTALYDV